MTTTHRIVLRKGPAAQGTSGHGHVRRVSGLRRDDAPRIESKRPGRDGHQSHILTRARRVLLYQRPAGVFVGG